MDIHSSIEEALHSRRIADLHEGQPSLPAASSSVFPRFRRRMVLWPLANSSSSILEILSALHAGIVPVVVSGDLSEARLEHLSARLPGLGTYFTGSISEPKLNVHAEDDVLFALLTSGSTGAPRIIATSAANVVAGVEAIHRAQELEACLCTAMLLPAAYSYAFVNQLLWSILYRRSLVVARGFAAPVDTFSRLDDVGASMLCLVASQFRMLSALGVEGLPRMAKVMRVNFAGAPFPLERLDDIRMLFPNARIFNNYGCTEAMPRLCVSEVHGPFDVGCVGKPIGNVQIRIADDGRIGAVQFRGSSSALGVVSPEGRLERFQGWIDSGDMGSLMPDGSLRVAGRHDQIVKLAGERLSLMEIEQTLLGCGFDHALAWKAPDEEAILAVVSAPTRAAPAVRGTLRALLPKVALPRCMYVAPHWRQLPNGKTDRETLKQEAQAGRLQTLW
jgi:long-chain acyl-CoA synthetase